eukprot:IDg181t1
MTDPGSSTPPVEDVVLTKGQALGKFNSLVLKANNFPSDNNHQKKFLSIAQAVLGSYPMSGGGGQPAKLPRRTDVKVTMTSLLPPPGITFTAEYLTKLLAQS